MKEEILLVVESVSNEKGVGRDIIFKAIERALASLTVKHYLENHKSDGDDEPGIRVAIDRETGSQETFRYWTVVDKDECLEEGQLPFPGYQITLEKAREIDTTLNIGDTIEEKIESVPFSRIGAYQARQIIAQAVREAERELAISRYEKRIGELLTGQVKRVTRDGIVVELGDGVEGYISRENVIPRESVRTGDRLRAYLYDVNRERKGPHVFLSRTCPEMLIELFRIEVPEIADGSISVEAASRDPGSRAKIAVKSRDKRIDPIGACVGIRGTRVQAVSSELNGERVDIVLWDDNPAQMVINAMAPAEIITIVVDEEPHSMDIAVSEEALSQAIGRSGQNVRLATQLTGWTLNIMSESDAAKKSEEDATKLSEQLVEQLDIDRELSDRLVQQGFMTLEDIAYSETDELGAIEGFDEDIVAELSHRAKKQLLARVIAGGKPSDYKKPSDDLLAIKGMLPDLASKLALAGIITQEDLASQSVDDLLDIQEMERQAAADLIMEARKPWFVDKKEDE